MSKDDWLDEIKAHPQRAEEIVRRELDVRFRQAIQDEMNQRLKDWLMGNKNSKPVGKISSGIPHEL